MSRDFKLYAGDTEKPQMIGTLEYARDAIALAGYYVDGYVQYAGRVVWQEARDRDVRHDMVAAVQLVTDRVEQHVAERVEGWLKRAKTGTHFVGPRFGATVGDLKEAIEDGVRVHGLAVTQEHVQAYLDACGALDKLRGHSEAGWDRKTNLALTGRPILLSDLKNITVCRVA